MSTAFNGTGGNDTIVSIRDRSTDVNTGSADEIINPAATQIHVWADQGSDTIRLGFKGVDVFTKGHHARGEERYYSGDLDSDTFVFQDLDEVTNGATVVGRIEDFDLSRDTLKINAGSGDVTIDPTAGSGTVGVYDWKIVEWDVDPGDSAVGTQQWLLIDTNGGYIFYALEGARVAPLGDGGAADGDQEDHFLNNVNELPPNFNALPAVAFEDPQNVVPDGFTPGNGGVMINEWDRTPADVNESISGSLNDDVIAAGLNDDRVGAKSGDDTVWGGTGDDTLNGGSGADVLFGGRDDDELNGGDGGDELHGERGNDVLNGEAGDDNILGGSGNDTLSGGAKDDTLNGNGDNDSVLGNAGNDLLLGGSGADTLKGGSGDDQLNGGSGNDRLNGGVDADTFVFKGQFGDDIVTDFTTSQAGEVIDLSEVTSIVGWTDLLNNHISDVNGNAVIDDGNGNTITLQGVLSTDLSAGDFIF